MLRGRDDLAVVLGFVNLVLIGRVMLAQKDTDYSLLDGLEAVSTAVQAHDERLDRPVENEPALLSRTQAFEGYALPKLSTIEAALGESFANRVTPKKNKTAPEKGEDDKAPEDS